MPVAFETTKTTPTAAAAAAAANTSIDRHRDTATGAVASTSSPPSSSTTATAALVCPLLALTPDETDELSHLFYAKSCGRIESIDDFRAMLVRAKLMVHDDLVLSLLFTEFCGDDGIVCEEFMDVARIIKSLWALSGPMKFEASTDDEELQSLFERLQQSQSTGSSSIPPQSVVDMIRSRRHAMENETSQRREAAQFAAEGLVSGRGPEKGAVGDGEQKKESLDHHHHENENIMSLLRDYEEYLTPAVASTAAAAAHPSSASATGTGLSLAWEDPLEDDDDDVSLGLSNSKAIDKAQRVLDSAVALLTRRRHHGATTTAEGPQGTVLHGTLRSVLSRFGIAPEDWDAVRTFESLGIAVDDDDDNDEEDMTKARALFADPRLYAALDFKLFCRLLEEKRKSKTLGGERYHHGQHSNSEEGHTIAAAAALNADDDEDQPDLLDVEDTMDGLQDVILEMNMQREDLVRRRSPDEDGSSEDGEVSQAGGGPHHGGPPHVTLIEDPVTGDLVTVEIPAALRGEERQALKSETHRLAAIETDLFMSPSRQRLLDEVREFVLSRDNHHHRRHGDVHDAGGPLYSGRRSSPTPRRIGGEGDESTSPHDGGLSLDPGGSTNVSNMESRKRLSLFPNKRNAAAASAAGGGGGGGHSETTSTTSSSMPRLHPLAVKLRQVMAKRLSKLRERLLAHHFPVNKKAAMHTGLTPTSSPLLGIGQLFHVAAAAASLHGGGVGETTTTTPQASTPHHHQPHTESVKQQHTTGFHSATNTTATTINNINNISSSPFPRCKSSIRDAAIFSSEEASFQRATLDVAFPACDMAYSDFYFVPQLKQLPAGAPLYLARKNKKQPASVSMFSGSGLGNTSTFEVMPGIASETLNAQPESCGYRTANSSANQPVAELELFHNHRQLRHSFLDTEDKAAEKRKPNPKWVARLSITPSPSPDLLLLHDSSRSTMADVDRSASRKHNTTTTTTTTTQQRTTTSNNNNNNNNNSSSSMSASRRPPLVANNRPSSSSNHRPATSSSSSSSHSRHIRTSSLSLSVDSAVKRPTPLLVGGGGGGSVKGEEEAASSRVRRALEKALRELSSSK